MWSQEECISWHAIADVGLFAHGLVAGRKLVDGRSAAYARTKAKRVCEASNCQKVGERRMNWMTLIRVLLQLLCLCICTCIPW